MAYLSLFLPFIHCMSFCDLFGNIHYGCVCGPEWAWILKSTSRWKYVSVIENHIFVVISLVFHIWCFIDLQLLVWNVILYFRQVFIGIIRAYFALNQCFLNSEMVFTGKSPQLLVRGGGQFWQKWLCAAMALLLLHKFVV